MSLAKIRAAIKLIDENRFERKSTAILLGWHKEPESEISIERDNKSRSVMLY